MAQLHQRKRPSLASKDKDTVTDANKPESRRRRYELLRGQLFLERSSFIEHWHELGDFILPRRTRFTNTDVNRGNKRNGRIIDATAGLAARTLRAGFMGGLTSPARPWKRLTTPDPDLAQFGPVKEWLATVDDRMSTIFLRSNLYQSLPTIYGDMGIFGTACMFVDEDFDRVIHTYPIALGSFYLANDDKLRVRVFMRDLRLTVRQVVMKFGQIGENGMPDWTNISNYVKNLWDRGQYEFWIDILHVVMPNPDADATKFHSRYKKYISCYYERGASNGNNLNYVDGGGFDADKYLSVMGYDLFPALAPRWEVTGEDVYGTSCPGMEMLGDIKQLQLGEKRSMQAVEKMVNPPMIGPSILRTQPSSILAGGTTWVDEREGTKGFRPAHEIDFRISELEQKQEQVRQRIKRGFFEDLFLMMASSDRREITAREVDERHEEKLLALGPVLERTNQDLLDPLIDLTFDKMLKQGLIPPPPPELQGQNLKVEYISIMAQAQKLIGLSGLDRFTGIIGSIVQTTGDRSVLDKVNMDALVDSYGDGLSLPPEVVRTEDQVTEIRQANAKAQQAAQQQEAIPQMAKSAKDLSQADLSGNNALARIVNPNLPTS